MFAPIESAERLAVIDVLRGFALCGILLVNFQGDIGSNFPASDERVVAWLDALVDSSFYPLFSLLFGLGFAELIGRLRGRGVPPELLLFRRLMVLFLIGTLHAVLLVGVQDILHRYTLAGLALLPFCRLRPRGVLLLAVTLLSLNVFSVPLRQAVGAPGTSTVAPALTALRAEDDRTFAQRRIRAELQPALNTYLVVNWHSYRNSIRRYTDWTWIPTGDHLMFFVVGIYVARRRWLHEASRHRVGWSLAAVVGLIAAVVGNVLSEQAQGWSTPARFLVVRLAADVGPSLFYLSGVILLVSLGGTLAGWLAVFAAPGRMALTNYLMQSVVMVGVFNAMWLGVGEPGASVRLVINFAFFFLVQAPVSAWWLGRLRFGPAEWAWRSATYGHLQPIRRWPTMVVGESHGA